MTNEISHGQKGHLSIYKLDHESFETSKGAHDRVVCFCPSGGQAYSRVDNKWQLGFPTNEQILKVFKRQNNLKGNWQIEKIEHYEDGADIYLKKH